MYQELVTLLRKKYDKAPLVMAAADAIETLDNQNKTWVSVADGLPEDREDVLCWLLNIYGEPYASVGCYNATFKMWDIDSEYAEPYSVTHWMPLPEMP